MSFTVGKRMVSYQPRATPEPGGNPSFAGGTPKAGTAILTMNTGVWNGHPPFNPRFQWFTGSISAGVFSGASFVNATNSTFAIPASASSVLLCRMSQGNAKWGTNWREVSTGTIIP